MPKERPFNRRPIGQQNAHTDSAVRALLSSVRGNPQLINIGRVNAISAQTGVPTHAILKKLQGRGITL